MKRRLKIALAYLLLLALSGCAIQPGDKTVVLPTPRATENANEQTEENDWTVRRIRQCEVVTGCVDEENQSVALGWSNGKLYVVEGAAGQAVSVRCVDPRYGFFETCAVLGKIDYERLKLSPDGSALLYTVRKETGEAEKGRKGCGYPVFVALSGRGLLLDGRWQPLFLLGDRFLFR